MRKRRGTRGAGYSKGKSHNKHRCWCKKWENSVCRLGLQLGWWYRPISLGRQCGFSYGYREESITRHCCTFSCKAVNRPSGAGKPLQQPANVTPSHHTLHNQTDNAADHTLTHCSTPDHISYLHTPLRSRQDSLGLAWNDILTKNWNANCKANFFQPKLKSYPH